jgi:hypothetical protein
MPSSVSFARAFRICTTAPMQDVFRSQRLV